MQTLTRSHRRGENTTTPPANHCQSRWRPSPESPLASLGAIGSIPDGTGGSAASFSAWLPAGSSFGLLPVLLRNAWY